MRDSGQDSERKKIKREKKSIKERQRNEFKNRSILICCHSEYVINIFSEMKDERQRRMSWRRVKEALNHSFGFCPWFERTVFINIFVWIAASVTPRLFLDVLTNS